jgi:retinol dehydrogenase-12
MPFSTKDIPDLSGKVFIVTGGNTGIGRITCLELARKKAHVILACRSEERTLPVIESIKKETGNDKVEFMKCDLSSLKSVDEFANAFINRKLPLHCLINNAGVVVAPPEGYKQIYLFITIKNLLLGRPPPAVDFSKSFYLVKSII